MNSKSIPIPSSGRQHNAINCDLEMYNLSTIPGSSTNTILRAHNGDDGLPANLQVQSDREQDPTIETNGIKQSSSSQLDLSGGRSVHCSLAGGLMVAFSDTRRVARVEMKPLPEPELHLNEQAQACTGTYLEHIRQTQKLNKCGGSPPPRCCNISN